MGSLASHSCPHCWHREGISVNSSGEKATDLDPILTVAPYAGRRLLGKTSFHRLREFREIILETSYHMDSGPVSGM